MRGQWQNQNSHINRFLTFLRFCLVLGFSILAACIFFPQSSFSSDLKLQDLIDEALRNNPEIRSAQSKLSASRFRIPQAGSLPDPMFMFGYQNEGTKNIYTFGKEMAPDSQWMFSVSQMIPFYGKLSLKREMAVRDFENLQARYESLRLRIISRVKELYYSLFLVYKTIDLLDKRTNLFSKIEDVAESRYKTGTGSLQDLLMAQTEKYMLLEKKEMLKQKIQSIEAMLNYTTGKDINAAVERPTEIEATLFRYSLNELLEIAILNSPDIKALESMVAGSEAKLKMAHREYYPDFTLTGSYFARSTLFPDMWSITTTINIPLFYKTKQRESVNENISLLSEARNELYAAKLMISASVRDNYSMFKTSERLIDLYKSGFIPKMHQDVELSIAAYIAGKSDALSVLTKIKNIIDTEILYWTQFIEREKAIAKLEELTALKITGYSNINDGEGKNRP